MTVILTDVEQYQFRDDGVLLNSDVNPEFFVDITRVDGLDNAPARMSVTEREGTHGVYVDSEFEGLRTVTLEGTIYAQPGAVEQYLDQLKANFAPTPTVQPLYFQTDNGLRQVFGKSQGLRYPKNNRRGLGVIDFQVQILCEDSRIYSTMRVEASVSLATVITTGRGYNKSYPFGYGAAVTYNSLQLILGGNRPSPGLLTIHGAVLNPSITNDATGTTMTFDIQLAAGDYLEIDLNTRSVRLNGIANRRKTLTMTGTWFEFSNGLNSLRFFGTQSPPTPTATLVAAAYSAWR